MKTKFILHGGFTPKSIQENDPFFKEILKSAPDNSKILLVYFAKELDRITSNKQEDILQFEKNKGNKVLSFEIANKNIFLEQIKKSDVIYLHGGSTVKLLDTLKKFSSLKESFEGKIIAADSAGTNSISCYCYSNMADVILEGVGIIPFKTICHYSDKHKRIVDNFNKYDNKLKLLLLREYQYQVFYQ
jgi:peptidase E